MKVCYVFFTAQGKPIDARSDIFSFGAVLYEMLTGERAFQGESKAMTLASILQKEPRLIGEVVKDMPPEVDRILGRGLRKDPQRRWQSTSDLKEVLHDLKVESDSGRLSLAGVYSVPITPQQFKVSTPVRRLTSGLGLNYAAPPARDGTMTVTNVKAIGELWMLPLDPLRGTLAGAPQRIAGDESAKQQPAISRNGARLAYVTASTLPPAKVEIRMRDLPEGRESSLMARGSNLAMIPKLSADGSVLAYEDLVEGKWRSFLLTGGAAPGRQICEGGGVRYGIVTINRERPISPYFPGRAQLTISSAI